MLEIRLKNGKILINENLFSFEKSVIDFLMLKNKSILILLDSKETDQKDDNVLCVKENGETLWRIKSNSYPFGPSPIMSIYFEENKLYVYRDVGIEEEIDENTGEVLSSDLIK